MNGWKQTFVCETFMIISVMDEKYTDHDLELKVDNIDYKLATIFSMQKSLQKDFTDVSKILSELKKTQNIIHLCQVKAKNLKK